MPTSRKDNLLRKPRWIGQAALVILLLAACNLPQRSSPPPSPSPALLSDTPPIPSETPAATEAVQIQATQTETPTMIPSAIPNNPTPAFAPGAKLTITFIDMIDGEQGWGETIVDDATWALLRTSDGGATWSATMPPAGYPAHSRFFALDGDTVWVVPAQADPGSAVAYGFVYRSENGGQTWQSSQPISLATGEEGLLETFISGALFFLDSDNGWLVVSVGHYMHQDVVVIFATQDGGLTWTRLTDKFQAGRDGSSAAMPCQVLGIAFVNPQKGWLAGNCLAVGVDERWNVLETNDGGKTWGMIDLPAPANAPQVVLEPETICASEGVRVRLPVTVILDFRCLVYDQASSALSYAFTYVSINGGRIWYGAEVTAVNFYEAQSGVGLGPQAQNGQRSLLVTADGGKIWKKTYSVTWPEAQLDWVDPARSWAVARRWNDETGQYDYALVFTQDGGDRWELIETRIQ